MNKPNILTLTLNRIEGFNKGWTDLNSIPFFILKDL